ncbi:thioesterase domain-containing protein [Clostridium sp.]|uniref:thioesterase domain-containing protein n=1 Tax=Clostridium sp. TaxID=1506 RepID=UPI003D6C9C80
MKDRTFFNNSLILLRRGSGEKNIVFIHDGSGEIIQYINFCKDIAKEYNIYGIRYDASSMTYAPKIHDISDIANKYIGYLNEIGVTEVYLIVGYCIGGKIAYEMCTKSKGIVPYLVLLNAIPPNQKRERNTFTLEEEKVFFRKTGIPFKTNRTIINTTEDLWRIFSKFLVRHKLIFWFIKKKMPIYMKNLIMKMHIDKDGEQVIKYLSLVRGFEETHYNYIIPARKINTLIYYFNAVDEEIKNYKEWTYFARETYFFDIKSDHIGLIAPENVKYMANNILGEIWANNEIGSEATIN